MNKIRAAITAVGSYVPEKILSNADLEKIVDTTDEWIRTRTGIVERRVLGDGLGSSYMAIKAVENLFQRKPIDPAEIDIIIFSTVTPDMMFPSSACIVQEKIGAVNAWGYDLIAACSSFLFALHTGVQFIETGYAKKVLVIGSDKMTSITNFKDRNTCVLFGDAAGCALLEPSEDPELGIMDAIMRIDGTGAKYLYMPGGGSLNPATHETVDKGWHYIFQDGQSVFKDAVKGMADVSMEIMKKNCLKVEDVSYLVPHQANLRILTACAKRVGISMDKVMVNIHKYGNTTSATLPVCLSEYWAEGKIKKGDNIILASFGAGYTWGALWLKWAY